jgi:hypothetical protein
VLYCPFDKEDQGHNLVLNALSTVLVQDSEVVAAMDCKPQPPASSSLGFEPTPHKTLALQRTETCPKLEAKHNASDDALTEDEESVQNLNGTEMLSSFVTVANPDHSDKYFNEFTDSQECIIIATSVSHMEKIMDRVKYWERCLHIP